MTEFFSPLPSLDLTSLPLNRISAASDPLTSEPPALNPAAHSELLATVEHLHAQLLSAQTDLETANAAADAALSAAQDQYNELAERLKAQEAQDDTGAPPQVRQNPRQVHFIATVSLLTRLSDHSVLKKARSYC